MVVNKLLNVNFGFNSFNKGLSISKKLDSNVARTLNSEKQITKELQKQSSLRDKQAGIVDKIISRTPLSRLVDMHDRMKSLNRDTKKLKGINFGDAIAQRFAQMGNTAQLFTKNLKVLVSQGIGGLVKGFSSLIPVITAVGAQLAVFAAPIIAAVAVIAGAVFTLKRIWENNIGGIQTFWFKIVGQIQDIWGRFSVRFNQALRKIGPLVKLFLIGPFTHIMGVLKIVGGLFDLLFNAIDPVLDVLGDLGKALLEPFNMFNKDGKTSLKVFDGIAKALGYVGKAIGFVVKILTIPLRLLIPILGYATKINLAFAKWFLKLKPVQFVIKSMKTLWDGIKFIIQEISKEWTKFTTGIEKALKLLGLVDDEEESISQKQQKRQSIISSPVSPQQVTNNNQRSNIINNNANIAVHSSGAINEKSAPRIGGILASTMGFQAKTI